MGTKFARFVVSVTAGVVVVLCLGSVSPAQAARPGVKTESAAAHLGAWSARLSVRYNPNGGYTPFSHIMVTASHHGVAVLSDVPVRARVGGGYMQPVTLPLKCLFLRHLASGGAPELVVVMTDGPGDPAMDYAVFDLNQSPPREQWIDLSDGVPSLVTVGARTFFAVQDWRFLNPFASMALSPQPFELYQYEPGPNTDPEDHRFTSAHLAVVTSEHPMLLRDDAAKQWRTYRRYLLKGLNVRGALAAWFADESLLGNATTAYRRLAQLARTPALNRGPPYYPRGAAYLQEVLGLVRNQGYMPAVATAPGGWRATYRAGLSLAEGFAISNVTSLTLTVTHHGATVLRRSYPWSYSNKSYIEPDLYHGAPLVFRHLTPGPNPALIIEVAVPPAVHTAQLEVFDFNHPGRKAVTLNLGSQNPSVITVANRTLIRGEDTNFSGAFAPLKVPSFGVLANEITTGAPLYDDPIAIYQYFPATKDGTATLQTVTADYPNLVRNDAATQWASYQHANHEHLDVRASLAAWAADQALLDHAEHAHSVLTTLAKSGVLSRGSHVRPTGEAYVRALFNELHTLGYTTTEIYGHLTRPTSPAPESGLHATWPRRPQPN